MFKFRKTTEEDLPGIAHAIAEDTDPQHAGLDPAFFYTDQNGVQCVTVEDEDGTAFYLRFENVVRVYAQFIPSADRKRTGAALAETIKHFVVATKKAGYLEMIFDSVSESLTKFCQRFGFKPSPIEYKIRL